jgi:hypothetical protein
MPIRPLGFEGLYAYICGDYTPLVLVSADEVVGPFEALLPFGPRT